MRTLKELAASIDAEVSYLDCYNTQLKNAVEKVNNIEAHIKTTKESITKKRIELIEILESEITAHERAEYKSRGSEKDG